MAAIDPRRTLADTASENEGKTFTDQMFYLAASCIHVPSCRLNKALDLFEHQSSRYTQTTQGPSRCPIYNHPDYIRMAAATPGGKRSYLD